MCHVAVAHFAEVLISLACNDFLGLQVPKPANIPESCQNVDGIKICFGHSLICSSCISFALKAKLMLFPSTVTCC